MMVMLVKLDAWKGYRLGGWELEDRGCSLKGL